MIKNEVEKNNSLTIGTNGAYMINDYDTILDTSLKDNEIGIGVVFISDNGTVYRGLINISEDMLLADGNHIEYIKQILSSLGTVNVIKIVYCGKDNSKYEYLSELFNNDFKPHLNQNGDYSFEYHESSYVSVDQNGIIDYENKELISDFNTNKIK